MNKLYQCNLQNVFYPRIIVCSGVGGDQRATALRVWNSNCGCFGGWEKRSSVFAHCNSNRSGFMNIIIMSFIQFCTNIYESRNFFFRFNT